MKQLLVIALLVVFVLPSACKKSSSQPEYKLHKDKGFVSSAPAAPPKAMSNQFLEAEETPGANLPPSMARKVILTGEMSLEVQSYDETLEKIKKLIEGSNGFISDSKVTIDTNGVKTGDVELRIPSDKFGAIIADIKAMGKLKSEAIHGQDVTEEYFDLEARLANSKKMEVRLIDLLQKQTKSVKDLLDVERELGRVRETIERFQGHKRFLDDRLSLSTITLELFEPATYTASVFEPLKATWSSMWSDLIASIAAVISFVFTAVPWAFLIGLAAWLANKLIRRWILKKTK